MKPDHAKKKVSKHDQKEPLDSISPAAGTLMDRPPATLAGWRPRRWERGSPAFRRAVAASRPGPRDALEDSPVCLSLPGLLLVSWWGLGWESWILTSGNWFNAQLSCCVQSIMRAETVPGLFPGVFLTLT
jgi:hypothetical protein